MSGKTIKFGDIKINENSKQHVLDCLDNNQITMGNKVSLFEKEWRELFGYSYCTAVNSGTSGVIASCIALYDFGAKIGDGVICPALTFIAGANGIRAAGLTPILVDVQKETLNIDVCSIEETIKNSPRHICAILATNLMGKPCQLDIIADIAHKYNLKVIIDNCEAYGSKYQGQYALHYGDMEITSHYTAHIIPSAEMGTVSTQNRNIRDTLISIRNHGRIPNSLYFDHIRYGLNLKPTDLHASIGLGQLPHFHSIFNRRKEILNIYKAATIQFENKFYFIEEDADCINAPHAFSFTLKEKYASDINSQFIKRKLEEHNIEVKRNFQNIIKSKSFNYLNNGHYPNADYISNYGWHIGCSDLMTDEDIEYTCKVLTGIFDLIEQ